MRQATPEFDDEMRRGMAYLGECAAELDITISRADARDELQRILP